jgi:hypothetical protein
LQDPVSKKNRKNQKVRRVIEASEILGAVKSLGIPAPEAQEVTILESSPG